ncbi:hypothetical protein STCU_08235 [Strigomonas culicis]|uniref:Uncharacterized protein n=1 Tax=Strigomonas culicis TaxID=28005 RepID=S9V5V8_9TRYP|nr:hypothetical protein STCU_08235 [Strigomonas culicis]|eukprot:EPY22336.1 hypothetical protein STCU_08235 [Strigomonas culicis]
MTFFFKGSLVLLKPYHRVPFARRSASGGVNVNLGVLSNQEKGDSFTEPQVYKSKSNLTARLKTHRKEALLRNEEHQKQSMSALGMGAQQAEELRRGRRMPMSPQERVAEAQEDADMVLRSTRETADYSTHVRSLIQREKDRKDYMLAKLEDAPTSKEFYKLFKNLRDEEESEEIIETYQKRLVDEYGIYPTTRVDAFMLDDDSLFPEWVHALPATVRDQVKYGRLGLTEEDEALRVRLGRMPLDRRVGEWRRLKKAKEYRAANEETLTLAELRLARQGKRRFHWLQRKRERRAAALRRMSMRKPEEAALWPSTAVDFSQRMAFIAQHVENGVQTNGLWPLSADDLLRAKWARQRAQREDVFVASSDGAASGAAHQSVVELLGSLQEKGKQYKRLSRKVYANRVNAVVHGDQDEFGRNYRKMKSQATHRRRAYDSFAEIALEKEVGKEPDVHVRGHHRGKNDGWSRVHHTWSDGMPSTRYGS